MKIFDLLWWFFGLDKHSSKVNTPAPPPAPKQQELDAVDPDEPDWFDDGDIDGEIFE